MPYAEEVFATSISKWASVLFDTIAQAHFDHLHLHTYWLPPERGIRTQERPRLIGEAFRELLRKKLRSVRGRLVPSGRPYQPGDALLQLGLTTPDSGLLSLTLPEEMRSLRYSLAPLVPSLIKIPEDKTHPSRAYRKLLEAFYFLGRTIQPAERCVDLGASPGGWTSVALRAGARVLAIDRSPLQPDLMKHQNLTFERGDAFDYTPPAPVDWLLCDVIAYPTRSIELIDRWLVQKLAKHLVVTVKLKGTEGDQVLEALKGRLRSALAASPSEPIQTVGIRHLVNNKNEVTCFASRSGPPLGVNRVE